MSTNLIPSAVFERLKEHLAVQANIPGAPCEIMITHTGYLLDHYLDKKGIERREYFKTFDELVIYLDDWLNKNSLKPVTGPAGAICYPSTMEEVNQVTDNGKFPI